MCHRHRRHCKVPTGDIATIGFSCKTVSRVNSSTTGVKKTALMDKNMATSTGFTFWAAICYVKWARPLVLLLENVDSLSDNPDDAEALPSLAASHNLQADAHDSF